MKFDPFTIEVLQNFSTINSNIYIDANSPIIKTVTPRKTALGVAQIEQTFECAISIYNLTEFLNVVAMFGDDYSFTSSTLSDEAHELIFTSSENDFRVRYVMTPKALIQTTDKDVIPITDILQFELNAATLERIKRSSGTMGLADMIITNLNEEDGNIDNANLETAKKTSIYVKVINNQSQDTSNSANLLIASANTDANILFEFGLKSELIKMMPNDYTVTVGTVEGTEQYGIKFISEKMAYYIALEKGVLRQ